MLDIAVSRAFGQHSLRATVSTITAVFQAVSQPPIAKFADVFGRVNAYLACVALYVIGYIIVPSSQNIYAYAAGNSIYILGITGLFLLQNIIISDISSLRSRYFWTIFPLMSLWLRLLSIVSFREVWICGDGVSRCVSDHYY
jgi:SIT family siderophore-iron:H+ symporter-like MFS transporter